MYWILGVLAVAGGLGVIGYTAIAIEAWQQRRRQTARARLLNKSQ